MRGAVYMNAVRVKGRRGGVCRGIGRRADRSVEISTAQAPRARKRCAHKQAVSIGLNSMAGVQFKLRNTRRRRRSC